MTIWTKKELKSFPNNFLFFPFSSSLSLSKLTPQLDGDVSCGQSIQVRPAFLILFFSLFFSNFDCFIPFLSFFSNHLLPNPQITPGKSRAEVISSFNREPFNLLEKAPDSQKYSVQTYFSCFAYFYIFEIKISR